MKRLSRPIASTLILFTLLSLVSACTSPTTAILSTSTPNSPSPTATSPIVEPSLAVSPTSPPAKNTPLPPTENALPVSTISDVPVGAPVALDGSLSPSEWEHSFRQEFSDEGELFLMQDGRYLYLGIHENFDDLTVTSVFVEFDDEISVMHSSGSLGTAIFKRRDEGWRLTQPFSWSLYQVTSHSPEDEKQRQDFLAANGWLANLGSMTETSEIEYQITIPDGPFRIAVAYLRPPNFSHPAWWPAGLSDDCLNVKLLQANVAEKLNPPLLLQFTPETWMTLDIPHQPSPAPAGQVTFYSERDGDAEIFTMDPDGSNQRPLTDNDADDFSPSWSPDGAQFVFESDRDDPHPHTCFPNCNYNLYLMDADGNNVRQLTALPGAEWGATWSPDGKSLLFTAGEIGYEAYGIYSIGLDGGESQPLLVDDFINAAPDWSPDGKQIAFTSNRDGNQDIYVMDADGNNVHKIVDTGLNDYFPDWSPDGTQIAFFSADWPSVKQDIYTVNVDGSNWVNLTNTPEVVDEDPKWSPDGNQIIFQSDRDGNFEIFVMNADGSQPKNLTRNPAPDYWPDWFNPAPAKITFVSDHSGRPQIYLMPVPGAQMPSIVPVSEWQPLTSGGQDNYFPAWSPDGKQIAYYTHFSWQSWAIMLVNADGSNPHQLTASDGDTICSFGPVWSPDGQTIAFTIEPNPHPTCEMKHTEIAIINTDGSGFKILTQNDANDIAYSISPDGLQLVFTSNRDGNDEIYLMNIDGSDPRRLSPLESKNSMPSLSPDGHTIAFVSNRDGNDEIYLMNTDGSNPRRLTNNTNSDWQPSWSPDGRQIIFISGTLTDGFDLFMMDADGTNSRQLSSAPGWQLEPAWQP